MWLPVQVSLSGSDSDEEGEEEEPMVTDKVVAVEKAKEKKEKKESSERRRRERSEKKARKSRSRGRDRARSRDRSRRRRDDGKKRRTRTPTRRSEVSRRSERPPEPRDPPREGHGHGKETKGREAEGATRNKPKGKGKKADTPKCEICGKPTTKELSGQKLHKYLNKNCLQWQFYKKMSDQERDIEDGWWAWRKAGHLAEELHAHRLAVDQREAEAHGEPAVKRARSRTPAVRLRPAQPQALLTRKSLCRSRPPRRRRSRVAVDPAGR